MHIAVVGATGLVGSALVAAAEKAGHEVIALSRQSGTDVLQPDGLADQLAGADALVDVTQSPSLSEDDAKAFFVVAATNLANAAKAAGVQRTVVLSIIGADQIAASSTEAGTGYDGYYRAKYVQEQTIAANAPGPRIVRSTQFHDISSQSIGWGRDGDQTTVPDLVTQTVAVQSMVEVLLGAATAEIDGDVIEAAGPKPEHLADLAARYAAHVGDPVTVVAAPVGEMVRDGLLLPHEGAHLVGPDFAEWLETVPVPQPTA